MMIRNSYMLTVNGQKLKIAMANAMLNPTKLCKKANVSYQCFARLSKEEPVKTETLGKFAKALGVKVEELI